MGLMANASSVARAASDNTPQIAQQSGLGHMRIQVRVYDHEVMPAADQTVALRAAAGVLAAAGIDVRWVRCGEDASTDNPQACDTPIGRAELSVRFVRLPGLPSARGKLRLGYSLVDTAIGEGELATVYVDRVHWLAVQAGADSAVVLGFAVAHEIGHLLLGTNAHAASGLMRAVWSRIELQHGELADWLFSPAEGSTMRASIAKREGLRSSQRDANGCFAPGGGAADSSAECGGDDSASLRRLAARTD